MTSCETIMEVLHCVLPAQGFLGNSGLRMVAPVQLHTGLAGNRATLF